MTREGCPDEDTQQSEWSPSTVHNSEPLIFVLIQPLTINESSVAYFEKGKLKNQTLSLCRGQHSTFSELKDKVIDPVCDADETRQYRGYSWAQCEEIRSILAVKRTSGNGGGESTLAAFCIMDDGLEEYRAHARMGFSKPSDDFWAKHDREAARGNLLIAFQKRGIHDEHISPPFAEINNHTTA
jgi:hypothetical protein